MIFMFLMLWLIIGGDEDIEGFDNFSFGLRESGLLLLLADKLPVVENFE